MIELKEPLFYNCCVACGVGSSQNTREMILSQIEKYGEFICTNCEEDFNKILESDKELIIETGFGKCETLITQDNIYRFEADRPKVCYLKSSFLGFGGAWVLITKDYKSKHGTKRKIYVSNNLFHVKRIPKPFQQAFKDKGKVNATVTFVNKSELEELRDILNSIPYLEVSS
jgi:hypothetical protein